MNPIEQREQDLVAQAKKGSQEAFAQLMEQSQQRMYQLAYRMTGQHQDAQDVCQEAFFKAWKALPNFKEESSFSTWLYRLTSNSAIDLLRKRKRQQESSLVEQFQGEEEELEIPDLREAPEDVLLQGEVRDKIHQGLEKLPPHHRQVLVMREVQGLSYQEIATTLALDLGTVKSRIARGRGALRGFLLEMREL